MIGICVVVCVIVILFTFTSNSRDRKTLNTQIKNTIDRENTYKQLINEYNDKLQELENIKKEYSEKNEILEKKRKEIIDKDNSYKNRIDSYYQKLIADRSISVPWLASMVSDFYDVCINENRCKITSVSDLKHELKKLKKENKILSYNLEYTQSLLPEIIECIEVETDIETEYLSKDEYNSLSDTEKNKLALSRYQSSKKTKWQIGRDFELCIGYHYEQQGYKVTYNGIQEKLNDLGRDLIAENNDTILIIQCKYWGKNKTIYEKHICQLYGTTVKYKIDNQTTKNIVPVFICHNELSDTAKEFAKYLNIQVFEKTDFKEYPMIKCNVSDKIYHLPFDQQYDTLKRENCELVFTIEQAEQLGCRRAYKWLG